MKKYLFFAAALFTLAACNNDDNLPTDNPNAPVEIRLSSGIQVQTRAAHNNLDTRLAAGEEVRVWVDDADSGVDKPNLYKNNILTVGDDQTTLSGGNPMYFPSTGNAVNIYAIHGNFEPNTDWSNFWSTNITHTVKQNQQSGESNTGYAVSDLVYCKSGNVPPNSNPTTVNLQFEHLLSKIEVVLVEGAGAPKIKQVEIINTKLQTKFTPDKENGVDVKADGPEEENPILIDIDTTPEADAKDGDKTNDILNEAIIVPQKVGGGKQFIRITTDEGGKLFYSLPEGGETFLSGKKYRYTITANLTGLTVTATIGDWLPTDDKTGTAEME